MRIARSTFVAVALFAALALPAAASATPSLTAITPAKVIAGQPVTATGTVMPVAAGEQVKLEELIGGAWTQIGATATTDAAGTWSVGFNPQRSGALRATQLTSTLGSSAEGAIIVLPKVMSAKLVGGTPYPFLGTIGTWKIAPAAYPNGTVVKIELSIDRRSAGFVRGRVKNGVVTAKLPTNGVGRFRTKLILPNIPDYGSITSTALAFTIKGRAVSSGSSRQWIKSLRAGLKFRAIFLPGGSGYDSRLGESVIAFHKAYGKPRTTSFNASDWKVLTTRRVAARDTSAALHIEIDKSRQILMQVKNGVPIMIIHISSGATGNTPVGRHKIQWKGLYVPSLYGSLLYRSMAFQGAYAIHGYPSVPTSAASHGCVRVPMWIADTLYKRTPVGTPVFVYQGPGSSMVSIGRDQGTDIPELAGVDVSRWVSES